MARAAENISTIPPSIPPRSRLRSSGASFKERSTVETLLHMGFAKNRALKAIAATGNLGVQKASDWLLAHVNDPALDDFEPREYILYLCPTGSLADVLAEFWDTTYQVCGWNAAHVYFPHITLSTFFKIPNDSLTIIDEAMKIAAEEIRKWSNKGLIGLDLVTQNKNFIGYFITSTFQKYIDRLMPILQSAFLKAGSDMKAQQNQLHMTLAFQYEEAHHDLLMKLSQEVNTQVQADWQLRVYSRDASVKGSEVRRIIKDYAAVQADELALQEGDYVYMEAEEHERSPDGWFKGTSYQSGLSGFFPGNFTIKCSQMEIWTLNRKLPMSLKKPPSPPNIQVNGIIPEHPPPETIENQSSNKDIYAKVNKPKTPQKLYIVRHGERCDFALSTRWFEQCFDSDGTYTRFNLNCPKTMVPRFYRDFIKDCPLTEIGKYQARLTGEALRDAGVSLSHVYCSPALRCVQTATEILKSLGSDCMLHIEPSLFEWMGWYKPLSPIFMSPRELSEAGFPIETTYKPHKLFDDISISETVENYYDRSTKFTNSAAKKPLATVIEKATNFLSTWIDREQREKETEILFVGHSGTLDSCTRQLQGRRMINNFKEFRDIVRGVPYCFVGAVQNQVDDQWVLCEPPVPTLTHGANKEYSWKAQDDQAWK